MRFTKYPLLLLSILIIANINLNGQQFATRKVKSTQDVYTDSLKKVEYNHVFPIFGKRVYKKGFDIPYPAGVMANYMWLRQGILINDLQLGFKNANQDIPLTPVDFIEFGDNLNQSWTVNVRPDLWVFPFLNVYGIFGYGNSHTEVNLVSPIELNSVVDQGITTYGVGVLLAFGIGPIWLSADANFTWNKPELLDKSVPVYVTGIRAGHTFVFKNRPYRNIGIWIGAMYASMGAETVGEVSLADAIPQETWDRRDEIVNNYWDWYGSLNPNNPLDKVKIEKADEVLTPIVDRLEAADGSATIRYGMNKQVKAHWNGLVGAQFQINKHWMIRSEGGVIGDRKSFLISANYRFLI